MSPSKLTTQTLNLKDLLSREELAEVKHTQDWK